MRIVGGSLRGRNLACPAGKDVRPTLDRVREALFNILSHASRWYEEDENPLYDGIVLDAFAGSGALGLEALSRGAQKAVFFDRDSKALAAIDENIKTLKLEDRASARRADATRPVKASTPASLIFLDPPYHQDLITPSIQALRAAGWIDDKTLIIAERDPRDAMTDIPGIDILDTRKYGRCQIDMMRLYS
ncbi:methyltransferase [Thalassospira profundimaris]|uniref:Methyltransferase n=1 Tax=Thalassospira profundimaris TaxID=502049 RepID=A0A367XFW8_9PROT|nr:16S rRNA (guanine(966)-N(2))-methyltransferase RsmD [Thalassospira profundimaris]RCK52309.1 methyltransferase [Thalassospira profundimaris]